MSAVKNDETGLWEVEVDGINYAFTKWGAEESLANLLKLSKLIGKPLGLAMGAFAKEGDKSLFDKEINFDILSLAIDALMSNMDEAMCISLIKKLSSQGVLFGEGAKITFNTHYEDRLDHLFKVVYAGLEVQYGNFFNAMLGLASKKKGLIPQVLRT